MDAAGQLLLMGIPGKQLDAETAQRLRRLQAGGYILFARNIESPEQLRRLIDDLRDLSEIEPIITIDQEGGRVSRLRYIGSEPPSAVELREKGDVKLIERHGRLTGKLLRLFGFNLDLCPVLDVSVDGDKNNSLRGRTWGTDTQQVVSNAGIFNAAMRRQGVLSCGKHFPGYGYAAIDPHHELPVIERTREQLEEEELLPFRTLMPEIDSMMIGHSFYTCFDEMDSAGRKLPASLSPQVVTQLLRNQLDYEGLIMTDDLDMGAILNDFDLRDTIELALHAGNNLCMICHRVEVVEEAKNIIAQLPAEQIDTALEYVEKFKKNMATPTKFSAENFDKIDAEIWQLRVDTLGIERAMLPTAEDGARSPVELY